MAAAHPDAPVLAGGGALGKAAHLFRDAAGYASPRIRAHYAAMRANQTLAFARRMRALYAPETFGARPVTAAGAAVLAAATGGGGRRLFPAAAVAAAAAPAPGGGLRCSVRAMFAVLAAFVDASDPDTSLPNLQHMLQTAERARAAGEPRWLVLTALLHDMGKACFIFGAAADGQEGTADGQQWALGGDTWIAGCALPASALFPELNATNPDAADPLLAAELGIYAPHCGLHLLTPVWGHDEYMYLWALANDTRLPPEALAIFRFHSCYPLHQGGDYTRFFAPGDAELLDVIRRFQQYDLYSKGDAVIDVDAVWGNYYQALIDEFIPSGDQTKW